MSARAKARKQRERPPVIVCDPYPAEASRVRRLLSPRYRLVVSTVPMEALDSILVGSFNAMVLALHENDRSFLGLIPLVKKLRPQMPIIVVADGRSLEEQRSAQRQGIFYFLPRPFAGKEMLSAVANAIERGVR